MSSTMNEPPLQPLPHNVQERVWAFVREQIKQHEEMAGAKVSKFEIHITAGGQIEVEVLGTENERAAAIGAGLEPEPEVNRLAQREELSIGDAARALSE
jgi:hypothetical protein